MNAQIKKFIAITILVFGFARQASALDLAILIPSLVSGKAFVVTISLLDGLAKDPIALILLPFAILNESNNQISFDEQNLLLSGYTRDEIEVYKNDFQKIGAALDGQTVTPAEYKLIVGALDLAPVSREIMQLN